MKLKSPPDQPLASLGAPPKAYGQLVQQLAHTDWIAQGTVVARSLRRKVNGRPVLRGPYYLWTCKVAGKTVCYSLSLQQYRCLKAAIANQRRVGNILRRLQDITFKTILQKVPGVKKRK